MEADGVAEPTPIRGDQNHSSPRARRHYGPTEVHCLVLVGDVRGQELDFHLLGDEVGKSLRLDSGVRDIPDVMTHELESPLGDSFRSIAVADDVCQWVRGDDHDPMVGEVVQEHSGRHQHGI